MALKIQAIAELQKYFNGVMCRADHHANQVDEIILAIAGGVIWKSTDDFQVRTYNGETANVLWMFVKDRKYCFKYDHKKEAILVCENSHNGDIIRIFTNNSTIKEVKEFFLALDEH